MPRDNLVEARAADAGDMELIPVGSFSEAIAALGEEFPEDTSAAA